MVEQKQPVIGIHDDVVTLKNIEEKDFPKILIWKNDFDLLVLNQANPFPATVKDIENWYYSNHEDKNQVLFGIYLVPEMELIGINRLSFIHWINGTAEVGIYIGNEEFRYRGYGYKSLKLILTYAFKTLKLRKLYLKVGASNENAIHLYEKIGFKQEGLYKDHVWNNGAYEDVLFMSLFAEEYLIQEGIESVPAI